LFVAPPATDPLKLQRPPNNYAVFKTIFIGFLFLDEKVTTVKIEYKNDSDFADSQHKIKEHNSLFKVCEDVRKLFIDFKYVIPSIKSK